MEVPKIDIDGIQYEKPTKNLLGLAIIEYIIWFAIGILTIVIFAATTMQRATMDPVSGELIRPAYNPGPFGVPIGLFAFACFFLIGPICAYFSVITRPLLMRPTNIIKWNERKKKKLMLYQQLPAYNLNCVKCNRSIPLDAKVCPYCSAKVEQTAVQNVNQKNIAYSQAVIQIKKQRAVKHIVAGLIWFIIGIVVTGATMASSASPIVVIMWGAIVFGFIEMIYGIIKYVTV